MGALRPYRVAWGETPSRALSARSASGRVRLSYWAVLATGGMEEDWTGRRGRVTVAGNEIGT